MKDFVFIYKMEKEISREEEISLMEELPLWRKERTGKMKNHEARLQSLMAGILLSFSLRKLTGAEISDQSFIQNEKGLFYAYQSGADKIYFNLSHAGQYVTAAFSDSSIGIDVECKNDKDFRITNRMMAAEDRQYIAEDQARFREVWTMKESFLKCLTLGISIPLNSFSSDFCQEPYVIAGENENLSFFRNKVLSKGYDLQGVNYNTFTARIPGEDYCISICSSKSNLILDIVTVKVLV